MNVTIVAYRIVIVYVCTASLSNYHRQEPYNVLYLVVVLLRFSCCFFLRRAISSHLIIAAKVILYNDVIAYYFTYFLFFLTNDVNSLLRLNKLEFFFVFCVYRVY